MYVKTFEHPRFKKILRFTILRFSLFITLLIYINNDLNILKYIIIAYILHRLKNLCIASLE